MGVNRTLKGLSDFSRSMGVKISLKTLERYSVQYNWQEKLVELDAKLETERLKTSLRDILEYEKRQINIGRSMQSIADMALKEYQDNIDKDGSIKLSIRDICSLVRNGTIIEKSTSNSSSTINLLITMLNDVLLEVAKIYGEVDRIENLELRRRQFAMRIDAYIDAYMTNLKNQMAS